MFPRAHPLPHAGLQNPDCCFEVSPTFSQQGRRSVYEETHTNGDVGFSYTVLHEQVTYVIFSSSAAPSYAAKRGRVAWFFEAGVTQSLGWYP